MKKKYRLLTAVLSGVMALSLTTGLAACSLCNDEEQPPNNTQTGSVVTLNKSTLSLKVGEQFTLVADVKVAGLNVEWSSSAVAVAEVNGGVVTANSEGTAEITAKVGDDVAKCVVTVTKADDDTSKPVITEDEWYEGGLYIKNNTDPDDVDLTEGLMAEDGDGNSLDITVTDDGGFTLEGVGNYTVKYEAVDADGVKAEFTRTVYVTYFGIEKDFIDAKKVSELTVWDYIGETEEEKTASEWLQVVVPGHSTNWNRFEITPSEIIMHGSDTFGRAGTDGTNIEAEDEDPNTILWNKVKVSENKNVLRIFAGNNPYPDYNNLLSKFRVSVLHLDDYSSEVALDYVEIKAPLNATGGGLNYERIRSNYVDVDLSEYAGQTVIVLIEQDSATDVYQKDYFKDIGYEDFQIDSGMIMETRDTLVVYGMRFISGEEKIDYSELELELDLDESTVWGTSDADANTWGLRGDLAAKTKWRTIPLNGATIQVINKETASGSLQIISRESSDDGAAILRDAVTLNKIKVSKRYFEIYVGTDSDNFSVNFRLSVMVDGKEEHLMPVWNMPGLEPIDGSEGWSTLCRSQWVYGVKLTYDLNDYLGKEAFILLEQDQNVGAGNVTLWFNRAELIDSLPELGAADYTAYNAKIAEIEAAEYNEEDYTELSWMRWTQALNTFKNVPQGLNSEQQEYITRAITAIDTAVNSLTLKRQPAQDVPEDNITGTLSTPVAGFKDSDWKALEVDAYGYWGTDDADYSYWGLRGDKGAKASWKYFTVGGELHNDANYGASLQSIVPELDTNDTDDFVADAVFVNRVYVTGNRLTIWAGCDNINHSVHMRVRLLLSDGTFVTLNTEEAEGYYVVKNGWLKLYAGQWTTGAEIVYDVSDYEGQVVTVLIEQDCDQDNTTTVNRTLWLNKVYFWTWRASLSQEVAGFDNKAWYDLELSERSEWGSDDRTNASAWGFRGDPAQTGRNEWEFYSRFTEKFNDTTGAIRLIGRENDANSNDADGIQADSLVANKTTVSGTELKISVGVGDAGNTVNVRVQLVLEDGSIVTLAVKNSVDGEYTALSDGWGKVSVSQWVWGTEITYDVSDYVGQVVTVLIEQDADQSNTEKENMVLWLLRVAYDGDEAEG